MTQEQVRKNLDRLVDEGLAGEAIRVWAVRQMVEHRDISRAELSEATGMSPTRISSALSGRAFLMKTLNGHHLLDRIEDGITRICDERGWVCRCTDGMFEVLARTLSKTRHGVDGT